MARPVGQQYEHEEDGEEETETDDFYSEYFIFQLETGCCDAAVVMGYLRRHHGDVIAAAAAYRSEMWTAGESGEAEAAGGGVTSAAAASEPALAALEIAGLEIARITANEASDAAADAEETAAVSEFWAVAAAPEVAAGDDAPCAICLAALWPSTAAEQGRLVVRLGCNHCYHHACIKLCIVSGSLCCPLCRQTFHSLARRHVMEASAEGEAAAAAVAASQGHQRLRLQQRLAERRAAREAAR